MTAEARVEFSLPARAENITLVRHALAGFAEALEMEPPGVADLMTVVTEACTNVVAHAYADTQSGVLEVDAWSEAECLVVQVRDFGAGVRPLADIEHTSLRLGLPLIAALTDSLEISGGRGRGTEVTMRVPLSVNGAQPEATAAAPEAGDETRISLPAGEALGPVLSRVISMFASRADLSVDELSDAVLISDALSAHSPDQFPDGKARIAISEEDGAFIIRIGPLGQGGGQRLLDGFQIPMLDATLETLANEVRIEPAAEGEVLMLRIARTG
jgi:serine/threonine-protein kinase RsbW